MSLCHPLSGPPVLVRCLLAGFSDVHPLGCSMPARFTSMPSNPRPCHAKLWPLNLMSCHATLWLSTRSHFVPRSGLQTRSHVVPRSGFQTFSHVVPRSGLQTCSHVVPHSGLPCLALPYTFSPHSHPLHLPPPAYCRQYPRFALPSTSFFEPELICASERTALLLWNQDTRCLEGVWEAINNAGSAVEFMKPAELGDTLLPPLAFEVYHHLLIP